MANNFVQDEMRQRCVCLTFAIPCITLKEIRDKLNTEMEYKYSNCTRLPLVCPSPSGKHSGDDCFVWM